MKTWTPNFVGGNAIRVGGANTMSNVLLKGLACEVVGQTDAASRVLVFSSNLDATVEISFLSPARFGASEICLAVTDDARMRILGEPGLEALFGIMEPTHVVFCRYWGDQLSTILGLANEAGAATLTFLDDNLLCVPPETGKNVFTYFQDEIRREVIERSIREVDLFVPSTPLLSEDLSIYRAGPVAEWNIYRSADPTELPEGGIASPRAVIGYMASESHAADLDAYVPALIKVLDARPGLRMEFFGTIRPPEALKVFGNRIVIRNKAESYLDFMQRLKRLRWTVGLAPLADTAFNRTKACTKWVEYTLADIPTIATSRAVYGRAADQNAVAMANPDTFLDTLIAMLDNQAMRDDLLAASRELISVEYRLDAHFVELRRTLEQATLVVGQRLASQEAVSPIGVEQEAASA